jgi:hypothetical protein
VCCHSGSQVQDRFAEKVFTCNNLPSKNNAGQFILHGEQWFRKVGLSRTHCWPRSTRPAPVSLVCDTLCAGTSCLLCHGALVVGYGIVYVYSIMLGVLGQW